MTTQQKREHNRNRAKRIADVFARRNREPLRCQAIFPKRKEKK